MIENFKLGLKIVLGLFFLYLTLRFVVALEGGIRSMIDYLTRSKVSSDNLIEDNLRGWSFGMIFGLVFCLVGFSAFVSKKASLTTFERFIPDYDDTKKIKDKKPVADNYNKDFNLASELITKDIERADSTLERTKRALSSKFEADKKRFEIQVQKYKDLEKIRNKNYTSLIAKWRDSIGVAEQKMNAGILEAEQTNSRLVQNLSSNLKSRESKLFSTRNQVLEEIDGRDRKDEETYEAWKKLWSKVLSWFASLAVILFIPCRIFVVIFEAKTETESEFRTVQEYFEGGLWPEFDMLLEVRFYREIRNLIRQGILAASPLEDLKESTFTIAKNSNGNSTEEEAEDSNENEEKKSEKSNDKKEPQKEGKIQLVEIPTNTVGNYDYEEIQKRKTTRYVEIAFG